MPQEARFSSTLSSFIDKNNAGAPVELYLFLSMSKNRKGTNPQTDESLLAFIRLVNRCRVLPTEVKKQVRLAIAKVKVVLSGEGLFELYVGKDRAKQEDQKWKTQQAQLLVTHLDKAFGFNPEEDIIGWETVIDNPWYARAIDDIKKMYREDEHLKKMVDDLISDHSHRYEIDKQNKEAAKEAVKEYIFRESAAFLCWGKVVCYPSPKFNPASQYLLEKLTNTGNPAYPGAYYLGYEFKPASAKQERNGKRALKAQPVYNFSSIPGVEPLPTPPIHQANLNSLSFFGNKNKKLALTLLHESQEAYTDYLKRHADYLHRQADYLQRQAEINKQLSLLIKEEIDSDNSSPDALIFNPSNSS